MSEINYTTSAMVDMIKTELSYYKGDTDHVGYLLSKIDESLASQKPVRIPEDALSENTRRLLLKRPVKEVREILCRAVLLIFSVKDPSFAEWLKKEKKVSVIIE